MTTMKFLVVLGLAVNLVSPTFAAAQAGVDPRPANDPTQKPAHAGQTDAPENKSNVAFDIVTVVEGLQNPWGVAFLPGGQMLVTERPGRLRVVRADGKLSDPVAGLPPVDARGQGGLLDVALDPAFAKNGLIYWSYAEPQADGSNNTAVARAKFVDDATAPRVENVEVIYHQQPSLPGSTQHYGSRLIFGRDGTLFITQGDRSITAGRMQAQNMDSLIGKIVRINTDGSIPRDNPFVGPGAASGPVGRPLAAASDPNAAGLRAKMWSIGHRNIQAAAFHPTTGELWEIEHGTRGGDELNIARQGKDYGWPTIAYGIEYRGGPITGGITAKEGMEQPVYYWDPVIGPSGMTFYTGNAFPAWKGSLFVGGHQTNDLVRLTLDGDKVVGEERLLTDQQPRVKVRDVRHGPDGALYLLSDDRTPTSKLLKLVPKK